MTIAPTSFLSNSPSPAASTSVAAVPNGFDQALGVAIASASTEGGPTSKTAGADALVLPLAAKGIRIDALLSTSLTGPATADALPNPAASTLVPPAAPEAVQAGIGVAEEPLAAIAVEPELARTAASVVVGARPTPPTVQVASDEPPRLATAASVAVPAPPATADALPTPAASTRVPPAAPEAVQAGIGVAEEPLVAIAVKPELARTAASVVVGAGPTPATVQVASAEPPRSATAASAAVPTPGAAPKTSPPAPPEVAASRVRAASDKSKGPQGAEAPDAAPDVHAAEAPLMPSPLQSATPPALSVPASWSAAASPSSELPPHHVIGSGSSVIADSVGVGVRSAESDGLAAATDFGDRLAGQGGTATPTARADAAASGSSSHVGNGSFGPSASLSAMPAAVHTEKAQDVPSIAAQPGRVGHDLGVHVARRLIDGGSELTVRLTPAGMGRVEVRMAFDESGTLRATVAAEHPAALDMLRRESADLGRALNDAGVRADVQSFRFDTRTGAGDGSQSGQRNGGQQDGGRQKPDGGHGYAADLPSNEPVYRTLRTSGRVDLMA